MSRSRRSAARRGPVRLERTRLDRITTTISSLRRGGRRGRTLRRVLALALLLAAAVIAIRPPGHTGPPGSPVVVAAHDLPAGAVIDRPDIALRRVANPPDGALVAPTEVTGRAAVGAVRRGEILTDRRIVGDDGPDPGPGRVAVPVRPGDPGLAGLLRVGMRVAVIGVDPDGSTRTLSAEAVVLSLPNSADDAANATPHTATPLVVLSVPSAVADAVTATAMTGTIGLRFA